MLNVKKKIFPELKNNNYNDLMYDEEGLWSITHPEYSDSITKTILKYSSSDSHIVDLTAGCGGNLISFGKYFNNVTGIEIDKNRFNILQNNINVYNLNINLINDDCINYLDKNYDIYFIDPPWGGPNYKYDNHLKLYLGDLEISDIINKIPKDENKLIVLKIPYNYNYDYIKIKFNILSVEKYNNIIILYFKLQS